MTNDDRIIKCLTYECKTLFIRALYFVVSASILPVVRRGSAGGLRSLIPKAMLVLCLTTTGGAR